MGMYVAGHVEGEYTAYGIPVSIFLFRLVVAPMKQMENFCA